MRNRFGASREYAGVIAAVLAAQGCGSRSSAVADVSVDASSNAGTLRVSIGQQSDNAAFFNSLGALPRLQALSPRWFRIHAGSDRNPAALPEPTATASWQQWDFTELNHLVEIAYASGGTPVMNVRYAPRSLWTCTAFFSGQAGSLRDATYAAFGDYLSRLVGYYNQGSFTDTASGATYSNPKATARRIQYWEIWNEPDLSDETPCASAAGPTSPALTSGQYLAMWNKVVPMMTAVDPTLSFVGPVSSVPQTGQSPEYASQLLGSSAVKKPAVVAIHGYGGPNASTDQILLSGDPGGILGLAGIVSGATQNLDWINRSATPGLPLWIDEINVSADLTDDPGARPWTSFGAAFGALAFKRSALLSASNPLVFFPFQLLENGRQQSMIDPSSGQPMLPYWREYFLSRAFNSGGTLLDVTSSNPSVEVLAVKQGSTGKIETMVVNGNPASPADKGGLGIAQRVSLSVSGTSVASASAWVIDSSTQAATGPAVQSQARADVSLSFQGYGVAFVEWVP